MPPLGTATSALSDLHSRLGDARVAGGLEATAACNPSRLRCSFHYTAVHTPTPAMPLLAHLGNRASLLLHRLVYAFPAASPPAPSPTLASDASPNFDSAPAPEPTPALSFMGSGYGVTLILMVRALPPAPAAHSAPADLAIGDTPQPHTPYRPSPPPAAA